MLLRVTNKNSFILVDKYDGIEYTFKPNEPVVIEEEAARHFFGYGTPDKVPYLVRQGWCVSSDKTDEAMKKLNNFVFEQGSVEFKGAEDTQSTSNKPEEVNDGDLPADVLELKNKVKSTQKASRLSPTNM